MRHIVLDTETTGLDPAQGHRIIEIGCTEIIDRKLTGEQYHVYINPERAIEAEAAAVHGINDAQLIDKPKFISIADDFFQFIQGAELIIHNAPFDVGFINHEFARLGTGFGTLEQHCTIVDTLQMARKRHPGKKNNLDALCKRYDIDTSHRQLHGALLDAELLATLYLVMTGGQISMNWNHTDNATPNPSHTTTLNTSAAVPQTPIHYANPQEIAAHQAWLQRLEQQGHCVWTDAPEQS